MADLRPLLERLKTLPELEGSTIVPASPDLLVLVPKTGQSFAQIKAALLQQAEVHELEVGEVPFRREGDKPYEQLRKEKLAEVLTSTKGRIQEQLREKLRELVRGRKKRKDGGNGAGKKKNGGEAAEADATAGNAQQAEKESEKEGEKKGGKKGEKAAGRAIKRAIKRAARKAKRRAAKREERAAAEL